MGGLDKYTGHGFQVAYVDPPWNYYGDPNKMAAAGKHYPLMDQKSIGSLPVKDILADKAAVFLWATGPRLDYAFETIKEWGLHYRGVAFIWIKTRQDGQPIGPQGVPPTFVKPVTEFVLAATTMKTGRPFPIHDFKARQLVFAPRGKHSQKPEEVRSRIDKLCGDVKKIELFSRAKVDGWTCSGFDLDGELY